MLSYKDFYSSLIIEELHPELQNEIADTSNRVAVQTRISKKIKDLVDRGEKTGLEGNQPKGSSRAYLQHSDQEDIMLDKKPAKITVGTKVAIRATLDKFHNKPKYDGMSLGQLQNKAEGADHYVNSRYRILTENTDKVGHLNGSFSSNKEDGIFPPLLSHDHTNHQYTQIGHCRDIKTAAEFKELTKHPDYPKGITHNDFCAALNREHDRNNGRYWGGTSDQESHLDHISKHPIVQKFMNYHNETGNPPYDYAQRKNLGVFEHPDGSKHLVARDHGFDTEVAHAYKVARINQHINGRNR